MVQVPGKVEYFEYLELKFYQNIEDDKEQNLGSFMPGKGCADWCFTHQ